MLFFLLRAWILWTRIYCMRRTARRKGRKRSESYTAFTKHVCFSSPLSCPWQVTFSLSSSARPSTKSVLNSTWSTLKGACLVKISSHCVGTFKVIHPGQCRKKPAKRGPGLPEFQRVVFQMPGLPMSLNCGCWTTETTPHRLISALPIITTKFYQYFQSPHRRKLFGNHIKNLFFECFAG